MLRRYISENAALDNSFASKFSGRQFQCLYLYHLLGATSEQVADIMGVSPDTVKEYAKRCKAVLTDLGMAHLSTFELWREMYQRRVIKQFVTDKSACLITTFKDIRTAEQLRLNPEPFVLSQCLNPDQSLNGQMAQMMSPRQQQCGYLFMIGATYEQIGQLLGFSTSNATEHIKKVRLELERFGMLKASRLIAWLFFFGHNYIRQEVHPDSPLLKYSYNDIREGLGMRKKYFMNW